MTIAPLPFWRPSAVRARPTRTSRDALQLGGRSGAATASTTMQLPAGARGPERGAASSRPAGTPSMRQLIRGAEVRQPERADRADPGHAAGRPIPPLNPKNKKKKNPPQ